MPDPNELRNKGRKVTPQRRLILEVLGEAGDHLTAEEIVKRARLKQPSMSAATVYRNLNILTELGFIDCVNLQDKGRCYEIENGHHHHHLVCLACGTAEEIGFCPISPMLQDLASGRGFDIRSHSFEIRGYCKKCQRGMDHER